MGQVVRAFKAVTARQIRLSGLPHFEWQKNYYDHVIRGEHDLARAREYIANNPLRWETEERRAGNAPRWQPCYLAAIDEASGEDSR